MTRRVLWGAPLARLLAADARQEIVDLLGEFAADLTSSNADGILKKTAGNMPERELFEQHVRGLLASAQVATSVEVRDFRQEAGQTRAELDWFLEIRRDGFNSVLSTQRRRRLVRCRFEKEGKRWKIAAIEPVAFFAPPGVD